MSVNKNLRGNTITLLPVFQEMGNTDDNAADEKSDDKGTMNEKAVMTLPETEEDRRSRNVDTWTYKAKNHLMYYPEGI